MRTALLAIPALVIAFALAWEFVPLEFAIWDGGYDLVVHVQRELVPIRSVSLKACRQRQDAEWTLENFALAEGYASIAVDPYDGKPIILKLPLSGRTSPMGRELRETQCRYLVVLAVLQDGRRVGKIVNIDYRMSREVIVSLR